MKWSQSCNDSSLSLFCSLQILVHKLSVTDIFLEELAYISSLHVQVAAVKLVLLLETAPRWGGSIGYGVAMRLLRKTLFDPFALITLLSHEI